MNLNQLTAIVTKNSEEKNTGNHLRILLRFIVGIKNPNLMEILEF